MRESPQEAGYDEPASTTRLVRHHLDETYDVEYSIPSCRRWLKEARHSYQKPRHENAKADSGAARSSMEPATKAPEARRHRSLYRPDQDLGQRRANTGLVPAEFTTQRGVIGIA